MTDPVLLVVYALAVARVTGIVTTDTITETIRDNIIGWLDDRPGTLGSYLAYLITCPWCASIWIAAVAAPLVWFHGENPVIIILGLWLAFSQITGMTNSAGR